MKCMNNKKGCPLYYILLMLNYIYAALGLSFSLMFVHMYMKYKALMQWCQVQDMLNVVSENSHANIITATYNCCSIIAASTNEYIKQNDVFVLT